MDPPTFLERIKQRKIVQWAVAYVAGAWLVLEILEQAIEVFQWPGVINRVAFVLAAFGFCVVLVIPLLLRISGGVQRIPEEAKPSPDSKAQKGSDAGSADLSHKSDRIPIAVLPFDDFSPKSDDSYFADGIHEEITSRLATISALAVKGRTSVGRYRVAPPPIPTIGQELGVSFLLEGSARIAGDRVRLTAQLIDAALDEHIWTETYDRRFSIENLFEVQEDIAQQVALAIGTEISPEDEVRIASRPTANLQAYVSYMKGMESWKQFTDEGTQQAIDQLKHAIALDSTFAEAYAGLATAYSQLGLGFGRGDEAPHKVMPLAKEAAHRAIQLNPESPDGYANLGFIILTYDFDYPEAERLLTRAVELDPERAISYGLLAHVYSVTGRHDRAVETSRRALELDPYEPVITTTIGFVLLNARRVEEAFAAAEQARAFHPGFPEMEVLFAAVYSFRGQYAEAVEAVQRISGSTGQSPKIRSMLAYHLARMGNEAAAREILEELLALADERYVSAKWIGYVYMGLGEDDQALEWFERAVDDRADWIVWINLLPGIDRYASNPRFQEILRRMNLSPDSAASADTEKKTIAVLPLQNMSGDPSQTFFADGMTEALITDLAKIQDFRVTSRTSVMRYRETSKSIPEIAGDLGVGLILEGSVMRAEDQVRVTAQLIDAATDAHLWAESYDRTVTNILSLQAEVAREVAQEVKGRLTTQDRARLGAQRSVDPAAHDAYLRGRHFWNLRGDNIQKGLQWFHRSLELDPDYAPAHAGIADTYALLGFYGIMRPLDAMPKAKAAARRALELDDQLGEPHACLGYVHTVFDWRWEDAEKEFQKAFELNPSNGSYWYWHSNLKGAVGRMDEAIVLLEEGLKYDPLNIYMHMHKGLTLFTAGHYSEAEEAYKRSLELEPSLTTARSSLGLVLHFQGRTEEGLREMMRCVEESGRHQWALWFLGSTYADLGRKDEAEAILSELTERRNNEFIINGFIASIHALLGRKDEAFRWLDVAFEEREFVLAGWGLHMPSWTFRGLEDDPRFIEILDRVREAAQ